MADRPIRVLHLVHWLNRGGIELWLLDLLRHTRRSDVVADICCKGADRGVLAPTAESLGAQVYHCPLQWSHRSFGRRLAKLITDHRYDIVHIHTGVAAGFPASVAAKIGVPSICSYHNTNFVAQATRGGGMLRSIRARYGQWSTRKAFEGATAITACSASVLNAINNYAGFECPKASIINYGTSMAPGRDEDRRRRTRESLGLQPGRPVGIHVGSFRHQKNHLTLLKAVDLIRQAVSEFQFLSVGDGPLRLEIESQFSALNLQPNGRLLGSRDDVEQLLEASDLFLFPSLWEGLPVSVLEAQMKGLPVIGSDIGPLQEATQAGVTSLLFPPDDARTMADAAIGLMRDEARLREFSNQAVDFSQKNFSIATCRDQFLELYRKVIQKAGR